MAAAAAENATSKSKGQIKTEVVATLDPQSRCVGQEAVTVWRLQKTSTVISKVSLGLGDWKATVFHSQFILQHSPVSKTFHIIWLQSS